MYDPKLGMLSNIPTITRGGDSSLSVYMCVIFLIQNKNERSPASYVQRSTALEKHQRALLAPRSKPDLISWLCLSDLYSPMSEPISLDYSKNHT